jgi:hypothetical protein
MFYELASGYEGSFFTRDTPAFGLYMVLYDFFANRFKDQKSLGLFWAGGLAGKAIEI